MVSSVTIFFSCRNPGRGGPPTCCSADVTKVLDQLIDNGMELKVDRK